MVIAGLGFKMSAAPFHQWTPDVYEGAPTPVTAFMSAATKVAAFMLTFRVLRTAFPQEAHLWTWALVGISIASLVIGNFAALVQRNVKRMLAYSSVSQPASSSSASRRGRRLGARAMVYYLIPYSAMAFGSFAIIGARERELNAPVTLDNIAGFGWERPFLGVAMWCFLFGFAGLPLTGGFTAQVLRLRGRVRPRLGLARRGRRARDARLALVLPRGGARDVHAQSAELRSPVAGGSPPREPWCTPRSGSAWSSRRLAVRGAAADRPRAACSRLPSLLTASPASSASRGGETWAFGFADRAHEIPNTPDTQFAIASGSKALTALVAEATLAPDSRARAARRGPAADRRPRHRAAADRPHSGIGDYYDEDVHTERDGTSCPSVHELRRPRTIWRCSTASRRSSSPASALLLQRRLRRAGAAGRACDGRARSTISSTGARLRRRDARHRLPPQRLAARPCRTRLPRGRAHERLPPAGARQRRRRHLHDARRHRPFWAFTDGFDRQSRAPTPACRFSSVPWHVHGDLEHGRRRMAGRPGAGRHERWTTLAARSGRTRSAPSPSRRDDGLLFSTAPSRRPTSASPTTPSSPLLPRAQSRAAASGPRSLSCKRLQNRGVEVTDPFEPGDELPGGVRGIRDRARTARSSTGCRRSGALIVGDVLLGAARSGAAAVPLRLARQRVTRRPARLAAAAARAADRAGARLARRAGACAERARSARRPPVTSVFVTVVSWSAPLLRSFAVLALTACGSGGSAAVTTVKQCPPRSARSRASPPTSPPSGPRRRDNAHGHRRRPPPPARGDRADLNLQRNRLIDHAAAAVATKCPAVLPGAGDGPADPGDPGRGRSVPVALTRGAGRSETGCSTRTATAAR